ncbi:MAG: hypothetical protein MJK13_15950, partial [Pseudomonadales bacterium]|nr:hypothetical protein [Pseudomonadales bacterium]
QRLHLYHTEIIHDKHFRIEPLRGKHGEMPAATMQSCPAVSHDFPAFSVRVLGAICLTSRHL